MNNRFKLMRTLGLFLCAAGLLSWQDCGAQNAKPPPAPPKLSDSQIKAWQEAAEKGGPLEQYALGKKYSDGLEIPQNLSSAALWYRKSAEGGYAKAQYHLGLACQEGEGLAKNLTEAARWYEKSSEQGFAKAQEKLGFMYWKGEGVTTNYVAAHKWLSLAGAGGEGKAAKGVKKLELSMTAQQISDAKKLRDSFTSKKVFKKSAKKGD